MGTTEDRGTKPCSKSGVTTLTEANQAEDASRVMVTPGQGTEPHSNIVPTTVTEGKQAEDASRVMVTLDHATEPPSKTVTTTMMEENQTKDASSVNVALEGHRTELSAKSVATIVTDTSVTDTREKEDQGTKSSLSKQKTIDVNELGRGWTKMQNMFTTRETTRKNSTCTSKKYSNTRLLFGQRLRVSYGYRPKFTLDKKKVLVCGV